MGGLNTATEFCVQTVSPRYMFGCSSILLPAEGTAPWTEPCRGVEWSQSPLWTWLWSAMLLVELARSDANGPKAQEVEQVDM